jgi:hypothetical protein
MRKDTKECGAMLIAFVVTLLVIAGIDVRGCDGVEPLCVALLVAPAIVAIAGLIARVVQDPSAIFYQG